MKTLLELDLSKSADRSVLLFAMESMICPASKAEPVDETGGEPTAQPVEKLTAADAAAVVESAEDAAAQESDPVADAAAPIVNGVDTEGLEIVDKATVEAAVNGLYKALKKRDEETGGKEATAMGAFVRKTVTDLGAKTIGELDDVLRSKFFEMFRVEYPA